MSDQWTSIERVRAALEHREPDRVPFDLGGSVLRAVARLDVAPQEILQHILLRLRRVAHSVVPGIQKTVEQSGQRRGNVASHPSAS